MITSVGIVGNGAFGALLHILFTKLTPGVAVRMYSSRAKPDGKTFFPLEEVAKSDAVILAVPIYAFEETIKRVLPHLGEWSVIVDVATVKLYTVEILKRLAPERRWVAVHPMWGPESYKKRGNSILGFRLVATDHTLSEQEMKNCSIFLSKLGFVVVRMGADEHDRHLAETLFLTHLVGQIVSRGKFDRSPIDTISFGSLMDAVESVRHDTDLFKDVFKYNPYCVEVLKRFEDAEEEVHRLLV